MKSIILQTAARYLFPLLVLYGVFLLVQGHHEPGGGFIGGLMTAAPIALCALAFDVRVARGLLPVAPVHLLAFGLAIAVGVGVVAMFSGEPFLTSGWVKVPLPGDESFELGTPLLFDVGVYFVVIGVVTQIVFSMAADAPLETGESKT